jgi:hypothetical protein
MKTLQTKYGKYIAEISDERGNGDGIWVYLKKEYADFEHDPYYPTRQIHEQTQRQLLQRFKWVRKITDSDLSKFPHLAH